MSLVSHRGHLLHGDLEVVDLSMCALPIGQSATGGAISKPGLKIGFIPTLRVMSRFGKRHFRICAIASNANLRMSRCFPHPLHMTTLNPLFNFNVALCKQPKRRNAGHRTDRRFLHMAICRPFRQHTKPLFASNFASHVEVMSQALSQRR